MSDLWQLKTRRESYSSEIHVKTGTMWRCYSDTGVRNKRIQWDFTFSTRQAPEGNSVFAKGRKASLYILFMGISQQCSGSVCHSLLQWTTFCQNSLLWPVFLGWPCTAWLRASLSYASPFSMTRLWSMKAGDIVVNKINQKIYFCETYSHGWRQRDKTSKFCNILEGENFHGKK